MTYQARPPEEFPSPEAIEAAAAAMAREEADVSPDERLRRGYAESQPSGYAAGKRAWAEQGRAA